MHKTIKEYFAKYLPVDGEIKEGDIVDVYCPVGEPPYEHEFIKVLSIERNEGLAHLADKSSIGIGYCTVVKLFLCSKDIQVGDKVYWTDPEGITSQFNTAIEVAEDMIFLSQRDASEIEAFPEQCIKVIGEISPDAFWVKEGDEFDRKQTLWIHYTMTVPIEIAIIKIKCPCCDRFA